MYAVTILALAVLTRDINVCRYFIYSFNIACWREGELLLPLFVTDSSLNFCRKVLRVCIYAFHFSLLNVLAS